MTNDEERFTPYAWAELRRRWARDQITLVQLSGQLLIWSQQLHEQLVIAQRAQEEMQHSLAALDGRVQGLEEQAAQS